MPLDEIWVRAISVDEYFAETKGFCLGIVRRVVLNGSSADRPAKIGAVATTRLRPLTAGTEAGV